MHCLEHPASPLCAHDTAVVRAKYCGVEWGAKASLSGGPALQILVKGLGICEEDFQHCFERPQAPSRVHRTCNAAVATKKAFLKLAAGVEPSPRRVQCAWQPGIEHSGRVLIRVSPRCLSRRRCSQVPATGPRVVGLQLLRDCLELPAQAVHLPLALAGLGLCCLLRNDNGRNRSLFLIT